MLLRAEEDFTFNGETVVDKEHQEKDALDNSIAIWFESIPNICIVTVFTLLNRVRVMVFNARFNNISVILWWSVLLVEETRVPLKNHWPDASHWQTLSHKVASSTPHLTMSRIQTHNFSLVVIGIDCTLRCKSNYHTITITTTTAPVVSHCTNIRQHFI